MILCGFYAYGGPPFPRPPVDRHCCDECFSLSESWARLDNDITSQSSGDFPAPWLSFRRRTKPRQFLVHKINCNARCVLYPLKSIFNGLIIDRKFPGAPIQQPQPNLSLYPCHSGIVSPRSLIVFHGPFFPKVCKARESHSVSM